MSDQPMDVRACIHEPNPDALNEYLKELRGYAEHLPGCGSMDRMDCGQLFSRSDWPCSCGLRTLLETPVIIGLPAGWIAVGDRQPDEPGEYLAAYRNTSGRWAMILDTYDSPAGSMANVWFSDGPLTGKQMPIRYWHQPPAFPYGELSK